MEAGEQIILFLNRRGYSTHLQCLKCGFVASCSDCSVNFTYHRTTTYLTCHTCGFVKKSPERCPTCNDPEIRFGGLGIQKVESVVRGVFPLARIFRMDSDTMKKKDDYRKTLTSFRAGEIDIMIGTQMIAKGLHFPNVTLVGIIFADQGLNLPDFRAGERTLQLLIQVAGRSGRGDIRGQVIVQTYTPYNKVLHYARNQDYESFYEYEIKNRKLLNFAPIHHMVMIFFKGEVENLVLETGTKFHKSIKSTLKEHVSFSPCVPCPVHKRRRQFYYQIVASTNKIVFVSKEIKKFLSTFKKPRGLTIFVNVDPYSVL